MPNSEAEKNINNEFTYDSSKLYVSFNKNRRSGSSDALSFRMNRCSGNVGRGNRCSGNSAVSGQMNRISGNTNRSSLELIQPYRKSKDLDAKKPVI